MPNTANQSVSISERNKANIKLAQDAADNDVSARKKVNTLIEPVIRYQTNRFCKRFCKENKLQFKCTLIPPIGSPPNDASLCEWGNASYAWMLDDLSKSNRLKKYQARNNATLFDYCYVIANSLPFYERWKDWRFGRKVYVPGYIRALGEIATLVFYNMRAQQSLEQISQTTAQPVNEIKNYSRKIVQLLTKKNKLYLLNPTKNVSLTNNSEDQAQSELDAETATFDEEIETVEDKLLLSKAWAKLSVIEQFVIEALVIEEQDAQIVLNALKKLDLSIKKGLAAEDIDRQQLYYFRRKTLAKLNNLMKIEK